MDIPFFPIKKENVEVLQIPPERTLEVIKVVPQERVSKRTEQNVDAPVPHVEFAKSSGEAVSSWPRASGTTSAAATAVAQSVGEARPPGIAKYSATTECRRASAACRQRNSRGGQDHSAGALDTS